MPAVYDDQDVKTRSDKKEADALNQLTGIDPSEEKAMEDRAYSGAAEDIAEKNGLGLNNGSRSSESTPSGEGFTDKTNKKEPFKVTRNNGIAGGLIGILVGGGFGITTFLSGPLQFLHLGQSLKQFHFSSQEGVGSSRMSKISRYVRYKGDAKKTRMSYIGNKYADRIERRFNKSGIASAYTENFGFSDGYIIDKTKLPPESPLNDIKNMTPEEGANFLKERYGVDVTIDGDGFKVGDTELGFFKSRKLTKNLMIDANMDGIGTALRARVMGKRGGLSWHPIKKMDKKLLKTLDERLAKFRKDRQARLDNGDVGDPDFKSSTEGEDGNGSAEDPEKTKTKGDVKSSVEQTANELREGSVETKNGILSSDGPMAKLKTSTSFKLAGSASAVIGIACLVKGIADSFDDVKYAGIVLPSIRLGMESISVASQIKSGRNVDMEQLAELSKQFYQSEEKLKANGLEETVPASSWASARSIQAERGEDLSGPDIPDEAKFNKDGNFVTRFMNAIPGLGTTCKAASSFIGQALTTTIDIVGGPISAAVGAGVGIFAGPILTSKLVNWLVGKPLDTASIKGAAFGNVVNYGARYASNDAMIASAGRELTNTETAELDNYARANLIDSQKTKSIASRVFDVTDANSLVAKAIIDNPGATDVNNLAKLPVNLLSMFGSSIKRLLPYSYAQAGSYDYGFPEYGFSVSEIDNVNIKNPYDNAEKAADILNGPNGKEYIERANKCFGVVIDPSNLDNVNGIKASENGTSKYNEISESNCTDSGTEWLRIRFLIFDTQTMNSLACYESIEDSCKEFGLDNSSGSNSNSSGSDTPVPTPDGPVDISDTELTTIGNIRVHKSIVNNVSRLLEDAKASGITLSGGGYRDSSGQIAVRKKNCGTSQYDIYEKPSGQCSPPTAIPGRSMHEKGLAIDFTQGGPTLSRNSSGFIWLQNNAEKYGLKNLPSEPWHWSTNGK